MLLPSKLQSGQNFKTATVKTVNSIIDYLKTQRISGDNKTIRVNHNSAGISLSAIENGGGRGGSGEPFSHPFKLSVVTDENGIQQISVKLGIVYFQGAYEGQYFGLAYQKVQGVEVPEYIPFNWQSVEDGFYAICAVIYDVEDQESGRYLEGCCLVVDQAQGQIPSAPGFYTFPIGTVYKQTLESEEQSTYALAIDAQGIVGDVILDDSHRHEPFAIRFSIDFGEEGELKSFEDFTVTASVNNGMIYDGGECFQLVDEEGVLAIQYGSYYAVVEENQIRWYTEEEFYNLQLSANCFCLCAFQYNGYIAYEQYIRGDLIFTGDNKNHPFKLKTEVDELGDLQLVMLNGDLRMQYTSTDIIRFEQRTIDFSGLEDGIYGVIGVAQSLSSGSIEAKVFFVTEEVTTFDIPSLAGFLSFPIGSIQVYSEQTPEGEASKKCRVINQFIYSDLYVDCRYFDLPFCAEVYIACEEGSVKSSREEFEVIGAKVNQGMIYDKNVPDASYVASMTVTVSDENNYTPQSGINYCYLEAKLNKQTGLRDFAIKWDTEVQPFFEYEGEILVTEKYVLACVYMNEILSIENYHPSDFIFEKADTYKVKANGYDEMNGLTEDPQPDFLINKLFSTRRSLDITQNCWDDFFSEGQSSPGYIYMQLDARPNKSSEIWFYWDFPSIPGWSEDYVTLNCKQGAPIWQPMGWIRIDAEDESPSFLPDKVTAKEPIKIEPKNGKLEFSIDMSKFVGNITVAEGGCFTIEDKSTDPVNNGKEYELKLDEDCLFNKLKITGENPIIVTGSGKEWKISFDDAEFVKTVSGGTCIKADKNGNNVKIDVDLDCIFENLTITGEAPITVTQDGKSYTISIDETKLGGKVQAGDCIKVEDNAETGAKTVSVDKECIFQTFTITGDDYITVTGSGEQWGLKLNPDVFGKVKVSETDTLGFLGEKIVSTNFIVAQNYGNSIGFQIGEDAIQCGDDSLEIYVTNGFATINSRGKVRVDENGELGYLHDKIQSSDQSLILQTTNDTVDLWINKQHFTSSDESILIQRGDTIDFKSTGKVKVSENDTADYLGEKIVIDPSISSLIALQNTGTQLKIKSAIEGSGIMIVNNGSITLLQAPSGKAVLVSQNGSLSWKEFAPCETACE